MARQSSSESSPRRDKITLKQIEQQKVEVKYKTIGDVELHLHLFRPDNHQTQDRRPCIVFFFGGGWVGGSPSQFYKQAWYLSQRGMVAACAEYRIQSKHKTTPIECVKDGKSAMRYLRSRASELGVDPNKIVAAGGSAGGHVAASTATVTKFNEATDNLEVSPVPNALVLFNPVLDNGPDGWGHKKVKDYWKDISPIHNIKNPAAPSLFMLGDQDKLLPVSVGQRYQKLVQENGGRCELRVTPNAPHGYFNRGAAFVDTLRATDRFLVSLGLIQGDETVQEKLGHLVEKPKKSKEGQNNDRKKSKKQQ